MQTSIDLYRCPLGGLRIYEEEKVKIFHSEGDLSVCSGTYPTILCVYVLICVPIYMAVR